MRVAVVAFVGVGGALGAALRFGVDSWLRPTFSGHIPWSTVAINVSGSLLLGLFTGLLAPSPLLAVLGSGVLGGYTTLSTASVEAATLLRARQWGPALTYAVTTLVLSVLGGILGLWLAACVSVRIG